MGSSRLEENDNQKTTSPQDIIDYLDELFAYALFLGMTYDQYWKDDPKLIFSYLKANEFKIKSRNQEMWLQGLYVHIAIGDLVPVINPFSKDHKAKRYLDKPIPLSQKEKEEQDKQRYNDKLNRFVDYLMSKTSNKEVSKK